MPINNLQKPVKLVADLWKQYWEVKQSGQPFKTADALKFLDELLQLPDIFSSSEAIGLEWENRTAADIDSLVQNAIEQVGDSAGLAKEKFIAIMDVVGSGLKLQLAFQKELPAPTPV